jgi:hypothetical protein
VAGSVAVGAFAFLVASCDSDRPTAVQPSVREPLLGVLTPPNGTGQCMVDDNNRWGPGGPINCTSNDIEIANVIVTQVNGQSYNGTDPIRCTAATVTLTMSLVLEETANSAREDVGIWIATDGGLAQTGTCNHYNLIPGTDGTFNNDTDQCAGIEESGSTIVDLGTLTIACTDPDNDGFLHLGGCVAWETPGQDGVCSDNRDKGIAPGTAASSEPSDFRAATLPSNPAKCNCDGFDIPVIIQGTVIIEKQTNPNGASGSFTFTQNLDASGNFSLSDNGTKSFTVDPGTYSVSESDPTPGFDLTSIVCTDPTTNSTVNLGTRTASINLAGGETITCVFTNRQRGSVVIEKQTNPNGASGSFAFSQNVDASGNFSLSDNGTKTFSNVAPGAYTVTESDPTPGFDLTALVCDDANSTENVGTRTAAINVEAGETVTCVYTNTQRGSVVIEKQTNPDGASGSFAFTQNVDNTGGFNLSDGGTKTFTNVSPGAYTVAESSPGPSFVLTALVCDDANSTENVGTRTAAINVEAGETVTCVYTNTQQALVRVVKTASGQPPSASQSFTFTLRTGATSALSGTTLETLVANSANGGTLNFTTYLTPGSTYQICEVVLPGWLSTISSQPNSFVIQTEPDGDNSTICAPFTPTAGELKIFSIDNTPPPGGLARTIGFWKNWSSCSNSNGKQTAVLDQTLAAAAGGGILIGDVFVNTCQEAVALLNKSAINTGKKMASDPAYNLAAQLLAAQLNIVAGAGSCPAANTAIAAAQSLLDAIGFVGTGDYRKNMTPTQISDANSYAATLDSYNNNTLCGP